MQKSNQENNEKRFMETMNMVQVLVQGKLKDKEELGRLKGSREYMRNEDE